VPGRPGFFHVVSPIDGIVLNQAFREELTRKSVKPNEPILRVGETEGGWEIELKIPQKHIGQILRAFKALDTDKLDVDLILKSMPTRTFKGKLFRRDVGGEANPNKDDPSDAEPVVLAYVQVEDPDIKDPLPKELLVTSTEIVAKVRCGPHAMGYSLFYGVWEFFYEKIVFFF
jgi:hypothetical protein